MFFLHCQVRCQIITNDLLVACNVDLGNLVLLLLVDLIDNRIGPVLLIKVSINLYVEKALRLKIGNSARCPSSMRFVIDANPLIHRQQILLRPTEDGACQR